MRRMRVCLLPTVLIATALAVAYAAMPGVARANDLKQQWGVSTLGETCGGKCLQGFLCCTAIVAPPA
jgi:hypothetical protein